MPDVTTQVVSLRLDHPTWVRYSAAAAARGKGLSTYLRDRLEREDALLDELAAIRRAVESGASSSPPGASPPAGVVVELLLLSRALAGPQKSEMAQQEVARLGLEVWRPAEALRGR